MPKEALQRRDLLGLSSDGEALEYVYPFARGTIMRKCNWPVSSPSSGLELRDFANAAAGAKLSHELMTGRSKV